MRKSLRRQLTRELRDNREKWEMQKALVIGSSLNLYRLAHGSRVEEMIKESDGPVISSRECRIGPLAEPFKELFRLTKLTVGQLNIPASKTVQVGMSFTSEMKITKEVASSKQGLSQVVYQHRF